MMMFLYLPATSRIPWARTLRRESPGSGSVSWCGLVKAESSSAGREEGGKEESSDPRSDGLQNSLFFFVKSNRAGHE